MIVANRATMQHYPFIHLEFGNIEISKVIDCFDSTISHDYLFFLIIFVIIPMSLQRHITVLYHTILTKKKKKK
jgi:hypothetical protein